MRCPRLGLEDSGGRRQGSRSVRGQRSGARAEERLKQFTLKALGALARIGKLVITIKTGEGVPWNNAVMGGNYRLIEAIESLDSPLGHVADFGTGDSAKNAKQDN